MYIYILSDNSEILIFVALINYFPFFKLMYIKIKVVFIMTRMRYKAKNIGVTLLYMFY